MQVFAKAHSDHEEIGNLEITTLRMDERVKLVALRVGIFVILAMVAVFIPVLHFVLVPAFLIAAVFAGIAASRFGQKVTSGEVNCPHCGQKIVIPPAPLRWPMACVCQGCASTVRIFAESQKMP
jgi:hypothetical protein